MGNDKIMTGKIDVHQHVVPPFWVEGLRERQLPHRPPFWSPESAIDFMDANGIATGILSLTAPGLAGWADDELRAMARRVNDYTAGLADQRPTRFGTFAILPLPDLDGALIEAAYALDTLAADGVVVYSNYGDRYLGDPWFEPLWAELDARAAVVFIHPTRLTQPELKGIPGPYVDFPFGTTRSAVQMALNGVLDRYSRMRVILSHGGGFLPYAAYRFASFSASGAPGAPERDTWAADTEKMLTTLRRFYLDTALASSPYALPSLKAFADPTRLLFGSDFPYAPKGIAEAHTSMLDASPLLSEVERGAIDRGNAEALFPRLQGQAREAARRMS